MSYIVLPKDSSFAFLFFLKSSSIKEYSSMQDQFCEYKPKVVWNTIICMFIAVILTIKLYFSIWIEILLGFAFLVHDCQCLAQNPAGREHSRPCFSHSGSLPDCRMLPAWTWTERQESWHPCFRLVDHLVAFIGWFYKNTSQCCSQFSFLTWWSIPFSLSPRAGGSWHAGRRQIGALASGGKSY